MTLGIRRRDFLGEKVLTGEAILMLTSGFHRNKSGVPYAFLFHIKYNIINMLIENKIFGTLMVTEQVPSAGLPASEKRGEGRGGMARNIRLENR
jgi:hypothetical protein